MTRLRVIDRTFRYPVGDSLARVRKAGGVSHLTPEQRAALRVKTVAPGDWCDDMPAESAAIYLERGHIARVTVEDETHG